MERRDLGYVRRRIESLSNSARGVGLYLRDDQSPEHIDQICEWFATTSDSLALRAKQLEALEAEYDVLTSRLARAEAVVEAVDRWYDLKANPDATFAEMQLAVLAIRAARDEWKQGTTDAPTEPGAGVGGG